MVGENIRLPHITGKTTEEQVAQLQRYMHQLVDQLNYNFGLINPDEAGEEEEREQVNAFGNLRIGSTLSLTSTADASGKELRENVPLIIGDSSGNHLELDGNEIMAKSNETTPSALWLNYDGGFVNIGSGNVDANTRVNISTANGTARLYVNENGTVAFARASSADGDSKTIVSCDANNVVRIDGYPAVNSNNVTGYVTSSLVVEQKVADNISVTSNSYKDGTVSVAKTGYKPLGVVGFTITNGSTGGTNGALNIASHLTITGNTLNYRIKSVSSGASVVKLTADILYVKS